MTWPLVNPVSGYSTLDRLVRTRFRPSTSTATFSGSGLMPLASPAWLRSGDTCRLNYRPQLWQNGSCAPPSPPDADRLPGSDVIRGSCGDLLIADTENGRVRMVTG